MKGIKRFFTSDLFMYLMLILFAPLGIFLMYRKGKFNKTFRIAISLIAIAVMFFSVGTTDSNSTLESIDNTVLANNALNESNATNVEENKDEVVHNEEKDESKTEEVEQPNLNNVTENNLNNVQASNDIFAGYRLISVDGGNLSGHREPNVVVDIGFGDRKYYAFTNEHGQLVKVIAKEIILQNEATEPVNSKGRYYPDEAKVPGVERKDLDEGHIIADSLGGVSNAYNITPQNSTLNRHGDQAYMEKVIRDAGGCTDFEAIITYPNTTTQIPSHYSYTYRINGNLIKDEFDNIDPDEYNKNNGVTKPSNNKPAPKPAEKPAEQPAPKPNGGNNIVYWTPKGKSYHTTKSCPTLSRSKTILEGTIGDSGKSDPCDRCH